jgi:hypothetical protein
VRAISEDALAATQEAVDVKRRLVQSRAVDIRRRLAQSRPDAFLALASSLHNLGSRLSAFGRHEEGLAATRGVAGTLGMDRLMQPSSEPMPLLRMARTCRDLRIRRQMPRSRST